MKEVGLVVIRKRKALCVLLLLCLLAVCLAPTVSNGGEDALAAHGGRWTVREGALWVDGGPGPKLVAEGTAVALRSRLAKTVPEFVFVKRHHFKKPFGIGSIIGWDIHRPGGGIYTCELTPSGAVEKELFHNDDGVVFDISLSFDARKLLFSWRNCREDDSFHIYELDLDGGAGDGGGGVAPRQLTTGRYHDIHPFYLPDGKIGFVSTRVEAYVLCQPGAACALHVMEPDGSNIRRIHFGTLADHSPFVMDDGSILFSRWEYQDKSLTYPQGLWTINPDGTRLQLFYGNTIYEPAVTWQGRQIPGRQEIVCTLAPHHGRPVGAVGLIDRSKGLENPRAIVNITPEIPYEPHRDRRGPGDRQFPWAYRDPHPVAKDLFLVAYGGPPKGGPQRYRIHALREDGAKAPIHEDKALSCFNPVPLTRRPVPHHKPELPVSDSPFGTFVVTDVYQGMTGVKRGEVKHIRVMRVEPKHCNMRGKRAFDMDPLIGRGTYYVKHCLGTVPVAENGTAVFNAPAGVELYFQALDARGMELQRMGTVTQIMPGETQSCIGCHEPEFAAPTDGDDVKRLLRQQPADIAPPRWGAGAVDFVKHVQPVFDRYCVECHSGVEPKNGLDLSGDKTRFFNMAYDNLIERKLVHYVWLLGASAKNWKPLSTGSRVSRLIAQMERAPCNVAMDDESRHRIYTWIEANVPYYGTYEHTRPGTPGSRDLWSAPWLKKLKQAVKTGFKETDVNLTRPERSRLLVNNLAKSAGGLADDARARFKSTQDPGYQVVLAAIKEGKAALDRKPRMDMPDGRPEPYPTDFGKLFSGFSGP
jgi:hypothetical protein